MSQIIMFHSRKALFIGAFKIIKCVVSYSAIQQRATIIYIRFWKNWYISANLGLSSGSRLQHCIIKSNISFVHAPEVVGFVGVKWKPSEWNQCCRFSITCWFVSSDKGTPSLHNENNSHMVTPNDHTSLFVDQRRWNDKVCTMFIYSYKIFIVTLYVFKVLLSLHFWYYSYHYIYFPRNPSKRYHISYAWWSSHCICGRSIFHIFCCFEIIGWVSRAKHCKVRYFHCITLANKAISAKRNIRKS